MTRLLSLFVVLVVLTGARLCMPPQPVDAQILVGVRFGPDGSVDDVMAKSTVQASASAGPVSGAIGVTGAVSLENGPSITPISKATFGP